jgi:hypothetical protein
MNEKPMLENHLSKKEKKIHEVIYYHNAPQYWIRAMSFSPHFSSSKGESSSDLKEIYVKDPRLRKPIISILNSSLFYWYFIVYSDGRHLNQREIATFPVNIDDMDESYLLQLSKYCDDLMNDLKKNSRIKNTIYEKHGKVSYQEFYPKMSKIIIDKIDKLLAKMYGFNEEEEKFVINFDIRFRMGEEN